MKAIVRTKAGKEFATMQVQDIEPPTLKADEVKIKMVSSRINPVDMDLMKGFPTLTYQEPQIGGVDGSGIIVAVGEQVKQRQVGEAVYFYRNFNDIGTWAEEITLAERDAAPIPKGLTPQQAGGIALPMLTAYECLMALQTRPGERLLIHGAGGGVGFQAVQLARAMGLKVIANASGQDQARLEAARIDQFINYKEEKFEQVLQDAPPDYVLDVIGGATLMASIGLRPKKVVSTAFADPNKMDRAGVKLPWALKLAMTWMGRKYVKAAQRQQVVLIGQVTGAHGSNLAAASRLAELISYQVPPFETLDWNRVESQGLSKEDIGKVLVFQ